MIEQNFSLLYGTKEEMEDCEEQYLLGILTPDFLQGLRYSTHSS